MKPEEPDETSPAAPRVQPVDLATATAEQRELLDRLGGDEALNLFGTLAHHPELMRSWLRFGGQLLQQGTLPGRERELVILRVAMRCGSDYEWGQHVGIARSAGLSDEEIASVGSPVVDKSWPADEATLLRSADELVTDHCLSERTWAELTEFYDTPQLIELTMLVGHYVMVAGTLRSLGVQTEQPLPTVGEV